jgi:hypothetical protein
MGVEVGHLEDLGLDSRIIENGFSKIGMGRQGMFLIGLVMIGTSGNRFRVP